MYYRCLAAEEAGRISQVSLYTQPARAPALCFAGPQIATPLISSNLIRWEDLVSRAEPASASALVAGGRKCHSESALQAGTVLQ